MKAANQCSVVNDAAAADVDAVVSKPKSGRNEV